MSKTSDARKIMSWLIDQDLVTEWDERSVDHRTTFRLVTANGKVHKWSGVQVLAFFAGACSVMDRQRRRGLPLS